MIKPEFDFLALYHKDGDWNGDVTKRMRESLKSWQSRNKELVVLDVTSSVGDKRIIMTVKYYKPIKKDLLTEKND